MVSATSSLKGPFLCKFAVDRLLSRATGHLLLAHPPMHGLCCVAQHGHLLCDLLRHVGFEFHMPQAARSDTRRPRITSFIISRAKPSHARSSDLRSIPVRTLVELSVN